jgi:Xaa-Pro aminopeptidase
VAGASTKRRRRAPHPILAGRLERVRAEMRRAGLPALLVTDRMDQIYLTGFTGEDGGALITPKAVHLLSDGRFVTNHKLEAPWAKFVQRKKTIADELGPLVKKLRLRRIGVQGGALTLSAAGAYRAAVRPAKLETEPGIVSRMRESKDAQDLRLMRRAIEVAETAYRKTLRTIRAGQTEIDAAARLEYEMRRLGAQRAAFDSIVAEGPNAALPHAQAGRRRLRSGSLLLIDWGAQVDWYCSDLTRTIFLDRASPRMVEVYKIVLEAQLAAIDAVRPGAKLADVDGVARKIIARAGYGRQFGHGLGHGLGMNVHEAPSVRWSATGELKPGMVVTIEPGIYLPGVGGVRIEDDVLVTKTGHNVLTNLSKDLADAII